MASSKINLTAAQKKSIRKDLFEGKSRYMIAKDYGCSINQVNGIWSQMLQASKREQNAKSAAAAGKSTAKAVSPTTESASKFMARSGRRVVRIDASNFDEVILVNGESEINVQIAS